MANVKEVLVFYLIFEYFFSHLFIFQVREQTKIAPEFWKYVNDSAFFSETDMTLVQVLKKQMIFLLKLFGRVHFLAKF